MHTFTLLRPATIFFLAFTPASEEEINYTDNVTCNDTNPNLKPHRMIEVDLNVLLVQQMSPAATLLLLKMVMLQVRLFLRN